MSYVEVFDGSIIGTLIRIWNTLLSVSSTVVSFLFTEFTIPFFGSYSVFDIMFGGAIVAYLTYKLIQAFTPL